MPSDSVVEDFDPFLDRRLCLESGSEPAVMDHLLFQGAPEALGRGVVVAVSFS